MEALGLNLGFLISQIVNFTLLAVLLYLLLYKPILRMLDARTARIRQGMEDAERAEKRAAEAQQEYERMVEEARREGQRVIAEATETSQKMATEIRARAEAEAVDIRQRAAEESGRQREQMAAELRREVGDLSIAVARQLIGSTVDAETQRRLVQKFLAEAEGLR